MIVIFVIISNPLLIITRKPVILAEVYLKAKQ